MIVGNLIAGSVVVETVFSRAGLGRLTQMSVMAQDIPVVLGIVVFGSVVFVIVNLVVDLCYPLIDPRIVDGRRGAGGASGRGESVRARADTGPAIDEDTKVGIHV